MVTMRRQALPVVGTLVVVLWGVSLLTAEAGQRGQAGAVNAVTELLDTVKNVDALAKAKTPDDILFGLASVQGGIIEAIEKVKAQGREQAAVAALLKVINSTKTSKVPTDYWTCAKSAWALGALGAAAKSALPTLQELTKHDNQVVAGDAAGAIKKIQG